MFRGLECLIGRARAVVPSRVAQHVAFLQVVGPLPLAKPFVVGVAEWESRAVLVAGFGAAVDGQAMRRVVLLEDATRRAIRVGLQVDGVEALTDVTDVEGRVAPSGPGSFFRNGKAENGDVVRVLDVDHLMEHVLGHT